MHFDLVDLRPFVPISEENSLPGGAERSHMSLPAASARIKNLEDRCGTRLWHRTGQGVTLTPPGQALLHHAAGDAAVGTAARHMEEYARGVKSHLTASSGGKLSIQLAQVGAVKRHFGPSREEIG